MDFKLPIEYQPVLFHVQETMIQDLELVASIETPLYECVFSPKTSFGKSSCAKWCKYFTNDVVFLKDTQTMIQKVYTKKRNHMEFKQLWDDLLIHPEFELKYQYIEQQRVEWLNTISPFLLGMSIYSMISPVLFLLSPIFMLMIPFFILRSKNIPITCTEYSVVLIGILKQHAVGAMFVRFTTATSGEKMYCLFACMMFGLQVYVNCNNCYQFYKNTNAIHHHIDKLKEFIQDSLESMNKLQDTCASLSTYEPFLLDMGKHKTVLESFHNELKEVHSLQYSFSEIQQLGTLRSLFYRLYKDTSLKLSIDYAFGMHGFLDNIRGVRVNIRKKVLTPCNYGTTSHFIDAYYPIPKKPVKNSYTLDHNYIITGPNASGKTTFIKSTLINVLLCQQIGFGYFTEATISPYSSLCCYLNIPDTSGRDSLFQAEARRCKQILETITGPTLCIFDELFSGTNPVEASASAYAFLDHLTRQPVTFLLTTHFMDVCHRTTNPSIQNVHMDTAWKNDSLHYSYKLVKGISTIQGGLQVLKDLNYPTSILEIAEQYISMSPCIS